MPYITDERLKSYLDTNQLHREQLSLAILSLDKRFSDVRPRHPRGGPDGGRDIEALFRGSQHAYGAVGFANQADDSEEKKKRIQSKFRDDLASALASDPKPEVFVFITNINLTLGEKNELELGARVKGIVHCEIFDRERLRIALDSPDGFSVRFQYLGIPLSEAEQASFFAKWGDDINSVISTGFQKVQRTLDHLLFLQEAMNSLSSLQVTFELNRVYKAEDIGHFRAFCSLYMKEPKLNILSILFGSTDKADRFREDISPDSRDTRTGIKFGIAGAQWEQYLDEYTSNNEEAHEKYKQVGSSSSVGMNEVRFITIKYYKDSFIRFFPVVSLRDIDEAMFLPFLNKSLAEKVKCIHVFSNGYKLVEASRDCFYVDETSFNPSIPEVFDELELNDHWVRIRPNRSSAFVISFSNEVPQRMFVSQQTQNSLPTRSQRY